MHLFYQDKYKVKGAYNDRYFRIALSAIAAHIIVLYYDPDSLFDAIFTISYLKGFIGSFIIAMLLTEYIHFVTVRLDIKYDWHIHTLYRIFWQTIIGFIAPAVLAFLLASLFFWINGYNVFDTVYLEQDFALIVVMLLTINLYYFGLNSFLKLRHMQTAVPLMTSEIEAQRVAPIAEKHNETNSINNEVPSIKEIIVVGTPSKSIPVRVEHISYCYILGGYAFVRTTDMESLSDSYQISNNLKTMEELLDKRMFFRINRRMIVNFTACKSFAPGKNKTLEVLLEPVPYPNGSKIPEEHERLCVVSEDRVTAFKLWMDR
jgi:DNA-binding LytR/AlgR family response regulator